MSPLNKSKREFIISQVKVKRVNVLLKGHVAGEHAVVNAYVGEISHKTRFGSIVNGWETDLSFDFYGLWPS